MKNIADIVNNTTDTRVVAIKKRVWWIITAIALLALLVVVGLLPDKNVPHISDMRVATIERGDMQVQIYGYGRLQSKHQRLLTAEARGVVEQVLLKPGAKVEPDSIILVLSAPDLLERLTDAELEFARVKADYDAEQLLQQNAVLAQEAQIAQLDSDLALAQLRVDAQAALITQGVVSQIDYQESKLSVQQLETRLAIAHQRRATLQTMAQQQTKIQNELFARYTARLSSLRDRVDRLQVRAGLHGVVQELAVAIGQSVSQGSELATIGSTSQLIAELRVAQAQADRIIPGHTAKILTQGSEIAARVTRLDPIVTDGRVMVELDVEGDLPANARPDLTVEGRIEVALLNDVLILEAPSDAAEFSTKRIFKLHPNNHIAEAVELRFGSLSGGQIEVLDGATQGESLIISDTSQWLGVERIELNI